MAAPVFKKPKVTTLPIPLRHERGGSDSVTDKNNAGDFVHE